MAPGPEYTGMNVHDVDFGRVAVLLGGGSAEREISLESGSAVLAALQRRGIAAIGLDPDRDVLQRLREERIDRVFIALHGRGGEDGQIQGALDTLGLPYTGSGVLGSALSMDKVRTKRIWQSQNLQTPAFVELRADADPEEVVAALGLPIMVKPAHEGSSLGATKVLQADELPAAYRSASRYDDAVLAESWITGAEYTAPILEGRALPLIRLETPRTFYDYEAKYHDDKTRYICPCGLAPEREAELQRLAVRAFDAVGASGWGRVDLMLDQDGRAFLIEVNTVPGMTSHSLVPMSARAAGIEFDELVLRILRTSMPAARTTQNARGVTPA